MKSFFALALLGAVVNSSDVSRKQKFTQSTKINEEKSTESDSDKQKSASTEDRIKFAKFASKNNKYYRNFREFAVREANWKKSQEKVQALNLKSKSAKFDGNAYTADWSDAEYNAMLGLQADAQSEARRAQLLLDGGNHRMLHQVQYQIDWVAEGRVHPVKSQGICGSCWSFAATTAQESMQAIKDTANPVRLSEQEGVDCTSNTTANNNLFGQTYNNYGCNGGWMNNYWNFSSDQGSMRNADYSYTGVDGTCQHDASKIFSRAGVDGQITTDIVDAKIQLQSGPMTIAVAAGNDCWRFYLSGILDSSNGCPTSYDHGVVIVGLDHVTFQQTITIPDQYTWTKNCVPMTHAEFMNEMICVNPNAKFNNDYPGKYCCEKELSVAGTTTVETVVLEYWLIQNSWGSDWGDSGFIRIAVEDGVGVSGMNQIMEWVSVQ